MLEIYIQELQGGFFLVDLEEEARHRVRSMSSWLDVVLPLAVKWAGAGVPPLLWPQLLRDSEREPIRVPVHESSAQRWGWIGLSPR